MPQKQNPNSSIGDFEYLDIDSSKVLVEGIIRAGIPGQFMDETGPIRLDDLICRYGKNLLWIRVVGDSMEGAGLRAGDLVVVAPSVTPKLDHLVAVHAEDREEPIVKRFTHQGLISEFADRKVKEKFTHAEIVGVVVFQLADRYANPK